MASDPTAVPAPSRTPPRPPRCVADTDIVVVGGGPVGATLAAVLQHRGLRVTVVERGACAPTLDVARSYTLGLNSHGLPALQCVPGLFEAVAPLTVAAPSLVSGVLAPNASYRRFEMPSENPVTSRFVLRADLVEALHTFLRGCKRVSVLHGAIVRAVACAHDGTVTLSLLRDTDINVGTGARRMVPECEDKPAALDTLRARLVFACDGANSAVLRELRGAAYEGAPVRSARGLDDVMYASPSSEISVKSLRLDASITALFERAAGGPIDPGTVLVLSGRGYGKRKAFLTCWPLSARGLSTVGGRLGSFAGRRDTTFLSVENVEEAYTFLEEVFPQIAVRELIAEKALSDFVSARATPLGNIRRCRSLVAHVGTAECGGVVLLGDAAHSFPPDMGQGVNCGLEDVCVLANVLDEASRRESEGAQAFALGDVLRMFEVARGPAIDGVLYLMRHGFPWQYGQNRFRLGVWFAKTMFLRALSMVAPSVFHPPVITLARNGVSYAEIKRRSELSFNRLCAGLGGLAATAAVIVARRRTTGPTK